LVTKLDLDANQELAVRHQVQSVPTVMVFHQGKLKKRQVGVVNLNALEGMVRPLLAEGS